MHARIPLSCIMRVVPTVRQSRAARSRSQGHRSRSGSTPAQAVRTAVAWLKAHASPATREGMARYNIPTAHALGVPMREIQAYAKRAGRDQDLANGLWATGLYEPRLLAAYVAEPVRLTPTLMDRWAKDFDNWAVCDTLCFVLFDRTPHAWGRVDAWADRRGEFVKRAAFALLWALALHDKTAPDARFVRGLALIEREAHDERHFVEKAIDMALRAIGRRNAALHAAALAVAGRLTSSSSRAAARIGRHAAAVLAARQPRRSGRSATS